MNIDEDLLFDMLNAVEIAPPAPIAKKKVTVRKPNIEFKGRKFVVTGKFENHSRGELEGMIRRAGGKFQHAVTFGTTYLVTANVGDYTKKRADAERKEVTCVTETEFLEAYNAL